MKRVLSLQLPLPATWLQKDFPLIEPTGIGEDPKSGDANALFSSAVGRWRREGHLPGTVQAAGAAQTRPVSQEDLCNESEGKLAGI